MNAPQIIVICLFVMGLTLHMVKHGEPRANPYHAGWYLLAIAIHAGLLYWGGFWG